MSRVTSVNDVRVLETSEPDGFGWGRMGEHKRVVSKAILFDYHGHELWIAKANLVIAGGSYWAKTWAIESAKAWAAAQKEQHSERRT